MNIRTIIAIFCLIPFSASLFSGCKSTNQAGSATVDPNSATVGDNSTPNVAGFLQTDYKMLDDWMNEPFQVTYRAMTPQLIFDQVPLNDIHYQTSNLPENVPPFNFESPRITRRELLKRIADFWNLRMSYINGDDGNPSAVAVSG